MTHWSQDIQALLMTFSSLLSWTMCLPQLQAIALWKSGWSQKTDLCKIWKMETTTLSSSVIKNRYHSPSGTHNQTSQWHQHLLIALLRSGISKMKRPRWIMSSMTIQRVWSGIIMESLWDVFQKIKWCIYTTQEFSENLLLLKQGMMELGHKKWSGLEIADRLSLWEIVLMAKVDSILSLIWDTYQMAPWWPKS